MKKKLIGIDWGTTSFRAYVIDQNGVVDQQIATDRGILSVPGKNFRAELQEQLNRLVELNNEWPIIASGMITSKLGWVETPYMKCPAGCETLSAGVIQHPFGEYTKGIHFVPGVSQTLPDADVMRGEETQLAGLAGQGSCCAILPGTHSKWVLLDKGIIKKFKTFMTGEMFSLLNKYSILKAQASGEWVEEAFQEGVREGYSSINNQQSLLSKLFNVRAKSLLRLTPNAQATSFLSGLLIGSEIGDAHHDEYAEASSIIIIGNDKLAKNYLDALSICSIHSTLGPKDLAAIGLHKIAQQKQLI